jgi:hypothetical protein
VKLSIEQLRKLLMRMQDEKVTEVVLKENGDGKLRVYVPETRLVQMSLTKRTRSAAGVRTP